MVNTKYTDTEYQYDGGDLGMVTLVCRADCKEFFNCPGMGQPGFKFCGEDQAYIEKMERRGMFELGEEE